MPCYLAALRPRDADHARRVLEALGEHVAVIDGRCCGQPAFNSGYREEAHRVGRELLRDARNVDLVVTPSGSCTAMVRHYLPGLFEGARNTGASAIAGRFREFCQYVAAHPAIERLGMRLDGVVAYHDSCHGRRELGITSDALSLLARVEGLEVRRLTHEDECCGFGGTFSAKLPEVAAAIVAAKLDDIRATGAHVVVSADLSCLAHIEGAARGRGEAIETWTIAELLARALP
ncbi:MAG: (Fe-S)-binding protein [Dehalococcoidia bacterium]